MFRRSPNGRLFAANIADIERRMQSLEKRFQRTAGRASANVAQAADHVGDAIIPALAEVINRFRGSAQSVGDEAARFGQEAARLGNNALRRVSDEVEHRPLMILAIAAGVGFLAAAAVVGRRH
jgi:ElaB/YqjD/DUF883 family membrane-anchored ribosome-binding protein